MTEESEGTEQAPAAEDERKAALEELKARCLAAHLECEEHSGPEAPHPLLMISFPQGRDKRRLFVGRLEHARALLGIKFQNYIFLAQYLAICSYKDDIVEGRIQFVRPFSTNQMYQDLFGIALGNNIDEIEVGEEMKEQCRIELHAPKAQSSGRITIGPCSDDMIALLGIMEPRLRLRSMTISITGFGISQHDQAVSILETLSNSVFLELEISRDISLSLTRRPGARMRVSRTRREQVVPDLNFPRHRYDKEALSLYWYAASAKGMPLLQFLAYYQVIEFYMPVHSRAEASRRIRNLLKDPTFDPHRDSDVGKLLSAVRPSTGRGFGDERSQLRATLHECLDQEELRSYFDEDSAMCDFLEKSKVLAVHQLPISKEHRDLRDDVADRLYEIRCKIVHTKSGVDDSGLDLLLPFSQEADQLYYDIDLIRYVARKVLIAGSAPLNL